MMTNEKSKIVVADGLGYEVLGKSTAVQSAQKAFDEILEAYKFLPNLTGIMANHPA